MGWPTQDIVIGIGVGSVGGSDGRSWGTPNGVSLGSEVVPALLRVVSPYNGPWRVVPALSPYDGPWRVVPALLRVVSLYDGP